jgi:hypothetical protein
LQRRQRLGIERAGWRRIDQVLFLRGRRTRGSEDEDGEQANSGAHQQLFLWIYVALVKVDGARLARTNVRFWHKADIALLSSDVRLWGQSGHSSQA